ncbi:MAG: class I SAM-dependent methyltransferase [bacterium]|nr:class I SAM-dependent methyltransferase [bacterium]
MLPSRDNTGWGKGTYSEKSYIRQRASEYERLVKEGSFIASMISDSYEKTAIDLGCGIGGHICGLAENGFRAIGIDINEQILKEARERIVLRNLSAGFICSDFYSSSPEGQFDCAMMLGGTFGLGDDRENFNLISSISEIIPAGGRIVIGSDNREYIVASAEYSRGGQKKWIKEDRYYICEESMFDLLSGRYNRRTERMDLSDGSKTVSDWTSVRLYALSEFRQIAAAAGFEIEHVFGSLLGHEYSASSKEMIVFAKRII